MWRIVACLIVLVIMFFAYAIYSCIKALPHKGEVWVSRHGTHAYILEVTPYEVWFSDRIDAGQYRLRYYRSLVNFLQTFSRYRGDCKL